ncbi:MAG: hypothetical protein ACLQDH_12325 [Dissulfurispiraceae bacterium]
MLKYSRLISFIMSVFLLFLFSGAGFALSDAEVLSLQNSLKGKSTGERIAFFAEQFVGTPYDIDPLGTYVTRSVIVADEKVDCMYLVFRAVELALSSTPAEAIQIALQKRFHSKGVISDGKVTNYTDRFVYGEDMISSGKWGKEITSEIGKTSVIQGVRSGESIDMLPRVEVLKRMEMLRSGDLIFFIKAPHRRASGEIVGHIGIITRSGANDVGIYLIHANGRKGKGGIVKKVAMRDYINKMPFTGVKITRFP